jgi:hypothetical protein
LNETPPPSQAFFFTPGFTLWDLKSLGKPGRVVLRGELNVAVPV